MVSFLKNLDTLITSKLWKGLLLEIILCCLNPNIFLKGKKINFKKEYFLQLEVLGRLEKLIMK